MQEDDKQHFLEIIRQYFAAEKAGMLAEEGDTYTEPELNIWEELDVFWLFGRRHAKIWTSEDRGEFNHNGFGTDSEYEGFKIRRKAFNAFVNRSSLDGWELGALLAQNEDLAKLYKDWKHLSNSDDATERRKEIIIELCDIIKTTMNFDSKVQVKFEQQFQSHFATYESEGDGVIVFYESRLKTDFFDLLEKTIHEFGHVSVTAYYHYLRNNCANESFEFADRIEVVKALAAIEQECFYSLDEEVYLGQLCEVQVTEFSCAARTEVYNSFSKKHVNELISKRRFKEKEAPENYFGTWHGLVLASTGLAIIGVGTAAMSFFKRYENFDADWSQKISSDASDNYSIKR